MPHRIRERWMAPPAWRRRFGFTYIRRLPRAPLICITAAVMRFE
ncbi:hypothetical protein BURCENBC7_AP3979 [Burkholderia cenocepacia BC7]|nr:uncharacterized protein BCN122_II0358 [Burkholderia cenocepacia]EPZ87651.1 hypothetical protein BURCENK562V_C5417 [Burkholderia cenocepacia K56-2Valvano]ERI29442.1 hypothetical protein BURCENBC7_AP3979 [Burkholderia cenocepacia BC7]WJN73014.1 hypothetical protein OH687_22155 [Burkholderia anthina]